MYTYIYRYIYTSYRIAGLEDHHVLVMRLYTSDSYPLFNNPMRAQIRRRHIRQTYKDEFFAEVRVCMHVFVCVCIYRGPSSAFARDFEKKLDSWHV